MNVRLETAGRMSDLADRLLAASGTTVEDMQEVGDAAIAIIYNRTTREHLDMYGRPFKPYSTHPTWFTQGKSDYAYLAQRAGGERRKAKRGPNKGKTYFYFKGGYRQFHVGLYGNDRPNLMKHHEMLGSSYSDKKRGFDVTDVAPTYITLEFVRPQERKKAQWNEDNGREFWGVGVRSGEKEILSAALAEAVEARIQAALSGNAK